MAESRIEVIGKGEFKPRDWLRKEVLWAYLMTPYSRQMAGWLDDSMTQHAQHNGNITRRNIYSAGDDTDMQALAFFNQGKNIGGLISSASLFEAWSVPALEGAHIDVLEVQARNVDRALGQIAIGPNMTEVLDDEIFGECAALAKSAELVDETRKESILLRANRVMTQLAANEASMWVQDSLQNKDNSLPILEVNDGGYPRSAGDRVTMLQPIFRKIVASEQYRTL